jgi:hypothetical protein
MWYNIKNFWYFYFPGKGDKWNCSTFRKKAQACLEVPYP